LLPFHEDPGLTFKKWLTPCIPGVWKGEEKNAAATAGACGENYKARKKKRKRKKGEREKEKKFV
jgi:hypothetical protein